MSTPTPGRKRLPVKPSEENLRKQAKRLARVESIQLAEAQHRIAVDYGCGNWAELIHLVEAMNRVADAPPKSSSSQPNKPLAAAARAKDVDAVRRILGAGQHTQEELDSGLSAALSHGDADVLWPRMQQIADLLLEYGANPDAPLVGQILDANPPLMESKGGWPPLCTAARAGRVEAVKLLISRGANVNARNDKGNTPLWFACQSGSSAADRIAVARLLIEAGAEVRAGCETGSTALHMAAWRGPVELVELLLRSGGQGVAAQSTGAEGHRPRPGGGQRRIVKKSSSCSTAR